MCTPHNMIWLLMLISYNHISTYSLSTIKIGFLFVFLLIYILQFLLTKCEWRKAKFTCNVLHLVSVPNNSSMRHSITVWRVYKNYTTVLSTCPNVRAPLLFLCILSNKNDLRNQSHITSNASICLCLLHLLLYLHFCLCFPFIHYR